MESLKRLFVFLTALMIIHCQPAISDQNLSSRAEDLSEKVLPKVVEWRRDFHQHPELSNREFRTAGIVAAHLRSLGLEVREQVAHTGVVGVLRGGKPGPVVALRADMDALPVTEETGLRFASKQTAVFNNRETGVMHACGHDFHTAILMGAAEVLASLKADIPGTVVFIFQPAEEGPPEGETGGAELMIEEGVLENPAPEVIFGLHVWPELKTGQLGWKAHGIMASANSYTITVRGRQSHGAMPWRGADPIVASAQIILGLQTIVSRQSDLILSPAVVTVGYINGGIRSNIIPETVTMGGTIRSLDPSTSKDLIRRIEHTAEKIAESSGVTAEFVLSEAGYPVTYNDPELTHRILPTLEKHSPMGLVNIPPTTGAEDFSYYSEKIPGVYFMLGVTDPDTPSDLIFPLHSPKFNPDEGALIYGIRAMTGVALDYMTGK